ncbi:aspartyl-phosphate phosphatase Spo0E family protein [Paenibacillus crassostreae]|uniref:Sporulation protein Spo0E n=1 Tax=Paenibacillus crassostreae TaxID=1763538 RepID=A0A167GTI3_9BACL|nr:aspartyl-phosphate phosphatase Spo0E family protein [Paenibacillus crassostreae]AOZ92081.1 aspartyl-phosphate phosphatase Spo0E family protein [Paenibacillus crassostreae]OAB77890.1 sporulation protein Spo0E [Paenibacillus crassostreae]
MFCADYDIPTYRGSNIAEGNRNKWSCETIDSLEREFTLKDEISLLRKQMEQLFVQEQSFTSDIVINISSLLDLKINEYMRYFSSKK